MTSQQMDTFLSFVRKETLHIVRDTRTMAIVLVMPVILGSSRKHGA